ncbi:Uncharacterised protein [Mycobacteroides abscessus subsp. abscessus]|nr:Uncharacterised protein [Mycobacteroides abscessus subsp. abscessus]
MVDRHQLGSPRDEDKGSGLIEEKSEYQRTTQDDRGSGFASLAQDEGEHPDSAGQEHQRRRLISDEMPIVRGGQRGAPRLGCRRFFGRRGATALPMGEAIASSCVVPEHVRTSRPGSQAVRVVLV